MKKVIVATLNNYINTSALYRFDFQLLNSEVCFANKEMRALVEDFRDKIQIFSNEIEKKYEKLLSNDKMNSLSEIIDDYKNSAYRSDKSRSYIRHLQRQISLLGSFYQLSESLRYICELI